MKVNLAYGKTGLPLDLPDGWNVTVIEPRHAPPLADPQAALAAALESPIGSPPLRSLVGPNDRVGVVISDITRPTPNRLILPAVLRALDGIPREHIVILNGLGTHRANTDTELRAMLGDEIVDGYRIVQNDAFDQSTQVYLGETARGHPIWLNRELVECDKKILTGFIEPHLFAGFSGGGKAAMPGMAGQKTVVANHSASMIAHPKSTWGETWGNPIWEEIREITRGINPTFLVNVTLDKDKRITGVFAGDLDAAHAQGVESLKGTAMVGVPAPFDIVVTSNSGYPLDLNLYQSIKGVSAASLVVRQGGAILIAADCWDGIPEHGEYGRLLREATSPRQMLDLICSPGFERQDQWQVQIQVQVQLKAEVYVHSHNLTPEQIRSALLQPAPDVVQTLSGLVHRYGPDARICILPEGPQTIPYVESRI